MEAENNGGPEQWRPEALAAGGSVLSLYLSDPSLSTEKVLKVLCLSENVYLLTRLRAGGLEGHGQRPRSALLGR